MNVCANFLPLTSSNDLIFLLSLFTTNILVVNKDNKNIKSFDDVKGKKLAQTFTSNYGELAKSKGAELVKVDGFNQAMDLLQSHLFTTNTPDE